MTLITDNHQNKHKLYFVGIGGVAMAACAVMFKNLDYQITGSDNAIYEPALSMLKNNHIKLCQSYSAKNIKQAAADLYIIGNSVSRSNPEVEEILNLKLTYTSLPELLKYHILNKRENIVVSGTHGKTTVTSMVAFLLDQAGLATGFMIGGKPGNFDVSARAGEKDGWFVIEGDEYDTYLFDKRSKFFHYPPKILIINNIEFDHADIFNNLDDIKKAFKLMLRQIPKSGTIIVNGDDENALEVAKAGFSRVISFGFADHCDAKISQINFNAAAYSSSFIFTYKDKNLHLSTNLIGKFNIKNALAAALASNISGVSWAKIKAALPNFKASFRRLNRLDKTGNIKIFDDFAHHPTAISETITALKTMYPQQTLHVLYQPSSNTAVSNCLQADLIKALALADKIIIYPSEKWHKKEPAKRLNLTELKQQLADKLQIVHDDANIFNHLKKNLRSNELVVFMGQSDFGGLPLKIANYVDRYPYNDQH